MSSACVWIFVLAFLVTSTGVGAQDSQPPSVGVPAQGTSPSSKKEPTESDKLIEAAKNNVQVVQWGFAIGGTVVGLLLIGGTIIGVIFTKLGYKTLTEQIKVAQDAKELNAKYEKTIEGLNEALKHLPLFSLHGSSASSAVVQLESQLWPPDTTDRVANVILDNTKQIMDACAKMEKLDDATRERLESWAKTSNAIAYKRQKKWLEAEEALLFVRLHQNDKERGALEDYNLACLYSLKYAEQSKEEDAIRALQKLKEACQADPRWGPRAEKEPEFIALKSAKPNEFKSASSGDRGPASQGSTHSAQI